MSALGLPASIDSGVYASDELFVEAVYKVFIRDFVDSCPDFRGARMGLKRLPLRNGKEATFYHMTTHGNDEENRVLDEARAERLPWARPIIENEQSSQLRVWTERKNGKNRVHLWLYQHNYVVVLDQRNDYFIPWTAFNVSYANYKQKLERRWRRHT